MRLFFAQPVSAQKNATTIFFSDLPFGNTVFATCAILRSYAVCCRILAMIASLLANFALFKVYIHPDCIIVNRTHLELATGGELQHIFF